MMLTRRAWLQSALALPGIAACRRGGGRASAALWFSYGGRNRVTLERLVRRYNACQSRYRIVPVFQGDYYEGLAKLRLALAAQRPPALSHVIGEVVPYLAEADVLQRLDSYPGAKTIDVIAELGQEKSWVGGGARPLMTLPFNRSTPIAYLNGTIFKKAKLAAPQTWTELREIAGKLTERRGRRTTRYGFECPISWWFWVAMVNQAGGHVVEPDGTVSLGGQAAIRAIEFWQTLVNEDRTMKPPAGRDAGANESTNSDFLSGRAAMIWTSTAFLKYFEDNASFPVITAPLPADRRAATPTGGTHFVILKGAPDAEKAVAWDFLHWMLKPAQVIEWATSTGYMPVTHSAVRQLDRDGYYRKNPNDRVAVDQLRVALPWPWSPDLFRVQREVVQPRLEEAVLAKADARALWAEAVRIAQRR